MAKTWARLKLDGSYPLRRGAWYVVSALVKDQVLVRTGGTLVSVPVAAVDLTSTTPSRWTVVPRPLTAVMVPATLAHYAVCPHCRHRVQLTALPTTLQCSRCGKLAPVAWDEAYLGRS